MNPANNFNFKKTEFDMDLFDLDRTKSIVNAFEELFPMLAYQLKTESTFYLELYPYAFSFYVIKQNYINQKDQSLIASSKAFQDVKEHLNLHFSEIEKALNLENINSSINSFELNENIDKTSL